METKYQILTAPTGIRALVPVHADTLPLYDIRPVVAYRFPEDHQAPAEALIDIDGSLYPVSELDVLSVCAIEDIPFYADQYERSRANRDAVDACRQAAWEEAAREKQNLLGPVKGGTP